MFVCGFLDISNSFVYESGFFSHSDFLSRFFFNVYLKDFDRFVLKNIRCFSSERFVFSSLDFVSFYSDNFVSLFLPLKSHKLFLFKAFKKSVFLDSYKLTRGFKFSSFSFGISSFVRAFYFSRFLDFFVMGFVGSYSGCLNIFRHVNTFVRSSLRWNIDFVTISSSYDKFLVFSKFNVRLKKVDNKGYGFLSKLRFSSKYFRMVFYRLELNKVKFSKQLSSVLNFQLLEYLENTLKSRVVSGFDFDRKKVCFCIFQLETIRSTQMGSLVLSNGQKPLFSSEFLFPYYQPSNLSFKVYDFKFYNSKLQLVLRRNLRSFIGIEGSFTNTINLYFNKVLEEYKKRLFLFYSQSFPFYETNIIFPQFTDKAFSGRFPKLGVGVFGSCNSIYFNSKSLNFKFAINKSFFYSFEIFANISGCLNTLRSWGCIHELKFRSKSNSQYLCFDDVLIIKSFGYFAYALIFWFRCCINFYSVKVLVSLIRESCFLTLCRKHNKTKGWAYSLYSNELINLERVAFSGSYFPSLTFLRKLKRKFYFSRKFVFFDERIFLV